MAYTKEEQQKRDKLARQLKRKNATLEEKEEQKRKRNEYNNKNRDKVNEYSKRNRIKQRDKHIKDSIRWRKENREKYNETRKKYVENNKDKIRKWGKIYREKNKKLRTERRRKRYKERIQNDPLYKMNLNARRLISSSFKRGAIKFKKSSKTETILGCTLEHFVQYILDKVPENITVNDFGKYGYHMDHIIPISTAKTEDEVIKLCHYTNFQPLWWKDNLEKSNKITN